MRRADQFGCHDTTHQEEGDLDHGRNQEEGTKRADPTHFGGRWTKSCHGLVVWTEAQRRTRDELQVSSRGSEVMVIHFISSLNKTSSFQNRFSISFCQ